MGVNHRRRGTDENKVRLWFGRHYGWPCRLCCSRGAGIAVTRSSI